MGTKVKGFFRGLKNISNIFDEGDEEPEIQIGMPTDVKHVAHIGADGPAAESPSWIRGFDGKNQSEPMDKTPERKKGTNNHRITRSEELTRDLSGVSKTTHRHHHHHHRHRSMDNSLDPESESSTKPMHTRRHHRLRRFKEKGDLPDIPKRSRRKNPNEDDGSTKSTQSKDSESSSHGPNLNH